MTEDEAGETPLDFLDQCHLTYANIEKQLKATSMDFSNGASQPSLRQGHLTHRQR